MMMVIAAIPASTVSAYEFHLSARYYWNYYAAYQMGNKVFSARTTWKTVDWLIGNSGTGKTHLACTWAFSACMQGRRVRFSTVPGFVTELLECREDRILGRLHKHLDRQNLVVLDELGYVPFSKTGAELLFEVVGRAYEHHSLIVTTNLPFENWTEVLDSERLTGALLDRLTQRVHIIEANGESYRLRQAKERAKRQSEKR